jgi:U3 small nucleolar RNA-associated protein 18
MDRNMAKAWQDADDDQLRIDPSLSMRTKKLSKEKLTGEEFSSKLREKYRSLYHPDWESSLVAKSSLSQLFLSSKTILNEKTPVLQSGSLEVNSLENANNSHPSSSVVTRVLFQDSSVLVAGKDKRLRVFRDGDQKTSVFFKDLPILQAETCSEKVYVSGEKPFFYIFDQVKENVQRVPFIQGYTKKALGALKISPDQRYAMFLGEGGKIMQVSTQSQKIVTEFKMNSDSHGLCFLDEFSVACGGDEGDVYVWDLKMRACVQRFADEGTVKITCLDAKDNFLAVGSNAGVVNLYDMSRKEFRENEPKPVKSVFNLTTDVTGVCFNHNCEVLAMYSKWKRDAFKLLHIPSLSVFSNWPSFRDKLKYPMTASFNSTSELLCIGNDEGQALLYNLRHYSS